MGSCCQDQKLEGDTMPLGVGADKSTEVQPNDTNNSRNCIHYGSDTYSDHNNVILMNTIKETKEECQIVMCAVEDNAQHRLEQPIEVSENGKKEYNEEIVCIMNASKLNTEIFKPIGDENPFNEQAGVSNVSNFDANDYIIEANISEQNDIEKPLATTSVSERNKFKYQKETDLVRLKQAELTDAIEQEIDEFHDLSPLRTNGIASYVGPLASVVFDGDQVRNEFETITFVSSGLDAPQNIETNCTIGKSACFNGIDNPCNDDADVGCGRNESNTSSIIVLRRKNPSCGASSKKILADGKPHKLSETRNSRRNEKKTVVNVDSTLLLSSVKLSDKYKRKRSLLHRSQHISIWGQLKNVTKVFEQYAKFENYGSNKHNNTNEKPKKVKSLVDNGKQNYGKVLVPSAKQSEAKRNDMQVGDKDVESPSPQNASVEHGDVLGFSSQIAPENFVETGTLPDSDNAHEAKGTVMNTGVATFADQNSGKSQLVVGIGASYVTVLHKKGKNDMLAPQLDGAENESKNLLKNNNAKQKPQKSVDSVNMITDNGSTSCNNFILDASVHEITESDCLEESCQMKRVLSEQDLSCSKSETSIQTENAKGQSRQKVQDQNQLNQHVQKSDRSSQTVEASMEASDNTKFSHEKTTASMMVPTPLGCNTDENFVVPEQLTSNGTLERSQAWVLCDDCEKWRCIPVELANSLDQTNTKWTCKDNTDKAFSDCSIPQEKSNAEIDAELGIPDEAEPSSKNPHSNGVELSNLKDVAASQDDSWTHIKSNVFLHRSRRTQNIDEIMVCQCKPLQDGRHGCGDECLNRMLNIECVKGTCPCHDLCSNQRFQKRKYAKFKWLRCGKKGYGLQLQEDVCEGQFLIEYVGEVLDLASYEARQRYYASIGQKHFYFMTLNGGEVIDARSKGNLGRYVNHSCEPNCRTEKWMVNGEVCIGLFAIRDVKKGEEITFDYNYERVFGAAAKKCICGSSKCRGYLGGDPLNSEIIVDSDEDDLEPVTIHEKHNLEPNLDDYISTNSNTKFAGNEEIPLERKGNSITHSPTNLEPKLYTEIKTASLDPSKLGNNISIQPLEDSKQCFNSNQQNSSISIPISKTQPLEISVHASSKTKETLSDSILDSKKLQITAKANSFSKASRSRGSVKMGRPSVKNVVSHKTKLSTFGAAGNHFDGVEEKLNALLDNDGGISKQRDSTKGYLKLLFVTAVEGEVGGCASRSARDLSLILDAIRKTRSRKVLVDIINKNGLQMLHNLIKQNRADFLRIPIIRKLLKILEFLALNGILTRELINKDSPHSGIESFKQSIIKLIGHNDRLIHQTAREFRDKYIPRKIKTVQSSNRDNRKSGRQLPPNSRNNLSAHDYHQTPDSRESDAIVIAGSDVPSSSTELNTPKESALPSPSTDTYSPIKSRKRKSRWDIPSDPKRASNNTDGEEFSKLDDPMQVDDDDDDAPPGFEKNHNVSEFSTETAVATDEVFVGCPQDIYYSHMPMSFGMPVDLMDKLGTLEFGDNQCNGKWAVAPAMPYHPYPPLPPYPREEERTVNAFDNGYRKPLFKERLRWPNKNFNRGFERRDMSHRRNGFNRFNGNMRNRSHNFGGGNMRRNFGGIFHPNSMNSNFNGFNSNLHRPYN